MVSHDLSTGQIMAGTQAQNLQNNFNTDTQIIHNLAHTFTLF